MPGYYQIVSDGGELELLHGCVIGDGGFCGSPRLLHPDEVIVPLCGASAR
jgi:hypothetical protein